ncbi:hypothetical protein BDQ17DRAFT_1425039 [Cyathus striatus]|nr:hypothetical protein BDQ17DRAFT_1425039 [Cyathus striatus]
MELMLSDDQIEAIASAKAALLTVGLNPDVLDDISRSHTISHVDPVSHINTDSSASGALSDEVSTSTTPVLHDGDNPPCGSVTSHHPATLFNSIDKKYHLTTNLKINRLLILDYLLNYPPGAVEEYLESALSPEGAVGHRFTIDPENFYHPKFNIQYSLGDRHGGVENVYCGELLHHAELGKPALCEKLYTTCTYSVIILLLFILLMFK